MTIPKVIKAHPGRADMVMNLKENHFPYARVSMDHGLGLFRNTRRQYRMLIDYCEEKGRDWGVMMEGDILPCKNLKSALPELIDQLPASAGLGSLYSGHNTGLVEKYDEQGCGFVNSNFIFFYFVLAHVEAVKQMEGVMDDLIDELEAGVQRDRFHDLRIKERFIEADWNDWEAYRYIPSLVQHIGVKSIVGHDLIDRSGNKRVSPVFVGKDSDARDYL